MVISSLPRSFLSRSCLLGRCPAAEKRPPRSRLWPGVPPVLLRIDLTGKCGGTGAVKDKAAATGVSSQGSTEQQRTCPCRPGSVAGRAAAAPWIPRVAVRGNEASFFSSLKFFWAARDCSYNLLKIWYETHIVFSLVVLFLFLQLQDLNMKEIPALRHH